MKIKEHTFTATITVTGCWDDDKYPGDQQATEELWTGAYMVVHLGNHEVSDGPF